MNRMLIAKEIRRISGLSVVATKFKFDPENVYVEQNYIACSFPNLEGSLQESTETLEKAKEDFARWLNEHGFLKRKGMFTSLVKSANWVVATDANSFSIGISLEELGLDKQTVKDKLGGRIYDNDEARERSRRKKEEEQRRLDGLTKDQFRRGYGKTIMKRMLERWK